MRLSSVVLLVASADHSSKAFAQQVYISNEGTASRKSCTSCDVLTPTYLLSQFSFTQTETYRTATSVPSPTTTTTYARPYSELSTLVPSLSTTVWGNWNPNATDRVSDSENPYGNSAWTALWERANPPNFTVTGLYSTTVSPTPIPSSELVLPPADYFGPTDCYNFPEDFVFGVAGSASQIEGAVASEGKTPSLMELLVRDSRPKNYVTNENYFLYKQDIERLASMGVKYYSFSIAWNRILPFALPGTPVNQAGIDHYNDLIDFVLEKGMIPTVTMLHFDTPLQFYGNLSTIADDAMIGYVNGGYQNETFQDAFVNYGKILLTHYADRVPIWFTFNEPLLYSDNGKAINNVVKAHARVYHFYHDELQAAGKLGIKFNDNFGVPRDPENSSHVDAANHFNAFQLATFANPIFLGIDYPEAFKMTIPDYVPLTTEDLAYVSHTSDFFGIDPYTATVVSPPPEGIADCAANSSSPYYPYCVIQATNNTFGWNIGYRSHSYVYTTPTYLRTYLSYLYNTFQAPVLISEFGFPVFNEADKELADQLYDSPRSNYYLSFMSEVLKSIWEDHVHVMGALAWSFADNWEFGDYTAQFGLQVVNRTTQTRYYKKSFFDLVDFVATRTPMKK
ncbi:beta-glucosidase [Phlyctema vagabunda]|uniref:Beta-glucosidase n=1 Tax=Phlyctema vagabunda TaxID=108571 RepID=A0ABR4P5Y7_9HELO